MKKSRQILVMTLTAAMTATGAVPAAASSTAESTAASVAEVSPEGRTVLTFGFDEGVGDPTEEAIAKFNASQSDIYVQSYHLPQDANNLHDDFVNKLVAQDTSVDVMALDVVYVA